MWVLCLSILFISVFSANVQSNLPIECSASGVFDVSSLSCIECTGDTEPDVLQRKCVCKMGYKKLYETDGTVTCDFCGAGISSSSDRERCLSCHSGTTTYNSETRECDCNDASQRLVEVALGSTLQNLGNKTCVSCPYHSKVSTANPYTCIQKCPVEMSYDTGSSECKCLYDEDRYVEEENYCYLKNSESSAGFTGDIQVTNLKLSLTVGASEISQHFASAQYKKIFLENVALCQGQLEPTACNAVANLCVLSLYDSNSRPCSIYQIGETAITNEVGYSGPLYSGWKEGYPWLQYPQASRSQVLARFLSVDFGKDLLFYVNEYEVTGEWLGMRRMQGNELFLCSKGSDYVENLFSKLGTNLDLECYLNLRYLFQRKEPTVLELFLKLEDDSLVPVPVQIKRMTGQQYNYFDIKHDDFPLYRRFFLYDNILLPNDVIRYLEEVSMNFYIASSKLRVPVITLKYGAREVSTLDLENLDVFNTSSVGSETLGSPLVKFTCEYESTQKTFFIIMLVFIILFAVVAVFITFLRCYLFMMRRKEQVLDFYLGFFSFFELANNMGNLFFILLLIYSFFYMCFYKFQGEVLVVVPTNYQNIGFFIVVPSCLLLKILDMVWSIYKQTSYDIFFIDWEKSKGRLEDSKDKKPTQVSCWRSYFVANQWMRVFNSEKYVHFASLYIIVAFFLVGLRIIYGANESIRWNPDDLIPTNVVIRYCLIAIFLMGWGLLEYFYRSWFHFRFIKDPLTNLIDLCCVSNVSIFIFCEKYYGYYIHGQSLHTYADINIKQFAKQLHSEEKDTVPHRGLDPQREGNTTCFQVYFAPEIRTDYDDLLTIPREAEEKKSRNVNIDLEFTKIKLHRLFYPEFSVGNVESLYDKHEELNKYLMKFIDTIKEEKEQVVKKEFQHRLGFPPFSESLKTKSIFMMDDQKSFSKLFLRGQAIKWLIFNILLFNCLDMLIKNVAIVSFICLVINQLLENIRQWLNFKNMHKKTLLDSRLFL